MSSSAKVVEFAGKFLANVAGEIITFDNIEDANKAVVLGEQREAMMGRVSAYCDARGLEGKARTGKEKVLIDFLAFEAVAETAE